MLASQSAGIKLNDRLDKHVVPTVANRRTRVRFPPLPTIWVIDMMEKKGFWFRPWAPFGSQYLFQSPVLARCICMAPRAIFLICVVMLSVVPWQVVLGTFVLMFTAMIIWVRKCIQGLSERRSSERVVQKLWSGLNLRAKGLLVLAPCILIYGLFFR